MLMSMRTLKFTLECCVSALHVNPASYLRQRVLHKLAAGAEVQSRTTHRPESNPREKSERKVREKSPREKNLRTIQEKKWRPQLLLPIEFPRWPSPLSLFRVVVVIPTSCSHSPSAQRLHRLLEKGAREERRTQWRKAVCHLFLSTQDAFPDRWKRFQQAIWVFQLNSDRI